MTLDLPRGSCDCHVHVFDPQRFPYAASRPYTPPAAPVEALAVLHRSLGIERAVLVQASPYGSDNRCLLAALAALGPRRARGVAVVDPASITDGDIDRLHEAGVRAIRLNLQVGGTGAAAAREQLAASRRVLDRHAWSLQVHANLGLVTELLDELCRLGVPVVLDHYAGGLAPDAQSEIALARLLRAMRAAPLYVKLSAPYHLWTGRLAAHPAALAARFHAHAPRQLLWGSDWPHPARSRRGRPLGEVEPFLDIDDAQLLGDMLRALPDDEARAQVLVTNPATLYGFPT